MTVWKKNKAKLVTPIRYEYEFVGGVNNSYSFVTTDKVRYEVRFVPSAYMFEEYLDPYIDGYEMIILVVDNPAGSRLPADARTEPTISTIFYDFFTLHERVVIFICDTADGRHEARARKFTSWYYNNVRTHYFKFDACIPDGAISILISIILHDQNTHFEEVVKVIKSLGRDAK